MKLNLNISSCVRASSLDSSCQKCVDICPTQTIKLHNNIPSFIPDECISCGGCVGICPTSSYALDSFNIIQFIFEYWNEPNAISCKQNAPCLAVFGAESLVTMTLGAKSDITLDVGHCKNCEIAHKLYPQIKHNIEEANYILSSFCDLKVIAQEIELESQDGGTNDISRRDFLSNINLKNIASAKAKLEEKIVSDELKKIDFDSNIIEQLKNKKIPELRKLFYTVMKNHEHPKVFEHIDGNEISFISQKYIDEKCTNCQMCYRVCPTGALNSEENFSIIKFSSIFCVKCSLCHDVCAYDALHLQKAFDMKELFLPTKRTLAKFDIRRCFECNNYFTYFGGEQICPRCQTEEEEAIMLHNSFKKD